MHVESWVNLTDDNPDTCTSDDIVAFTWQTPQPAETIKASTVGALIVEFSRLRGDNAVYRYDSINEEVYAQLRNAAQSFDAGQFEKIFNQEIRNHNRGVNFERRSQA